LAILYGSGAAVILRILLIYRLLVELIQL
jgi:hypothetical protein